MGQYKTERTIVDVSLIPFIPILVKKAAITDTKTDEKAEGCDGRSYERAEAKAWEKLKRGGA